MEVTFDLMQLSPFRASYPIKGACLFVIIYDNEVVSCAIYLTEYRAKSMENV